jgi:hypothetical protein
VVPTYPLLIDDEIIKETAPESTGNYRQTPDGAALY